MTLIIDKSFEEYLKRVADAIEFDYVMESTNHYVFYKKKTKSTPIVTKKIPKDFINS